MYAVNAVYDGTRILTEEPISVKGRYEVIVTFTKPLANDSQDDILKYFGMWNNDDLNSVLSVVNEREKFSLGSNLPSVALMTVPFLTQQIYMPI